MKALITTLVAIVFIVGCSLVTAAYKSRISRVTETGLAGVDYFEDFILGTTGTAYQDYTTNSGSVNGQVYTDASGESRSTTVLLSIMNGTDDEAAVTSGWFDMPEGASITWATDLAVKYPTTEGKLIFGLIGSFIDPYIPLNGAWFSSNPSVSANWVLVRMVDGTPAQTVTSIPVEDEFTRLKIVYNCDRAVYYINGVVVGTIDTGGQNTARVRASLRALQTDAGANVTYVYADYSWVTYQFPTPRPTP